MSKSWWRVEGVLLLMDAAVHIATESTRAAAFRAADRARATGAYREASIAVWEITQPTRDSRPQTIRQIRQPPPRRRRGR